MLGAPILQTNNRPTSCNNVAADGSSIANDSAGASVRDYSKLMLTRAMQSAAP